MANTESGAARVSRVLDEIGIGTNGDITVNEILSLADRILVMYEGRIMGELAQEEATAEKLGLLMAGSRLE